MADGPNSGASVPDAHTQGAPNPTASDGDKPPIKSTLAGGTWQAVPVAPSANIAVVAWNAGRKMLRIEFHRGNRVYQYRGVDAATVEAMSQAPSSGRFFDAFVKNQYPFEEVR